MTNKKIGLLQLTSLTFFLTITSFPLFFNKIIFYSQTDTIISIILGSIITLFSFKIILKLRKKTNFNNKYLKILIVILLSSFYIYLLITSTNFVKTTFLSNGNFYSIIILIILMSFVISLRNHKEIASLSLILLFLFIPLFITTFLSSTKSLNFSYLKPPLITPFSNIFISSFIFFIYLIIPLLLLLFIPYKDIDQQKKQDKYLYLAVIFGLIKILIEYIIMYFTITPNIQLFYDYPFMLVINTLSSSFVLNRLAYLISFYLVIPLIITLSLLISIIKQLILNTYNHHFLN